MRMLWSYNVQFSEAKMAEKDVFQHEMLNGSKSMIPEVF